MEKSSRSNYVIPFFVFYLIIPVMYLLLGDFPARSVLKNMISFLTVGAYFMMLGQFYLNRSNTLTLKGRKMSGVINLHKILGYVFIPVLILHPYLIVVPRYFEAGVAPLDAFKTIMTTFDNKGIIMGMAAMVLMILLGITSMLRKKMRIKYLAWRTFHGILSIAFIVLATWHAVGLGRHTDTILSSYMIFLSALGIILLIRTYVIDIKTRRKSNERKERK